jgi:hypothetical protein
MLARGGKPRAAAPRENTGDSTPPACGGQRSMKIDTAEGMV